MEVQDTYIYTNSYFVPLSFQNRHSDVENPEVPPYGDHISKVLLFSHYCKTVEMLHAIK